MLEVKRKIVARANGETSMQPVYENKPTRGKAAVLGVAAALAASIGLSACETAQRLSPGGLFRPSSVPEEPSNPEMAKRIDAFEAEAREDAAFPSLADMPSSPPNVPPRAERAALSDAAADAGAALNAAAADDAARAAAERAAPLLPGAPEGE